MKNYFIITVLFLLSMQHTIFSMQNIYDKKSLLSKDNNCSVNKIDNTLIATDEYVKTINAAVKSKKIPFFSHFTKPVPTKDEKFLNIITSINEFPIAPSEHLISQMCQNKRFKKAVAYFTSFARQNLDNATVKTLEIVQDSSAVQPTPQLNTLPAVIKQYVMKSAYDSINCSYDMVLPHANNVNCFDINVNSNSVATSCVDDTLHLWDLAQGKLVCTFPGDSNGAHLIGFNSDGSRVATARHCNDDVSDIKIWNTQSGLFIDGSLVNRKIKTLNYGSHNTLFLSSEENQVPEISVLMFNDKDKLVTASAKNLSFAAVKKEESYLTWNNKDTFYEAKNPYKQSTINNLDSKLTVRKSHCRSFYLCDKAVKNSHSFDAIQTLNIIENLPLFQKLTPYEQAVVTKPLLVRPSKFSIDEII